MNSLLQFIREENARLCEQHPGLDETSRPLARAVKLNEEVGELCDGVLAHDSLQRGRKLEAFDRDELATEVADVLITALLLADTLDIDVETATAARIETIEHRHD